MAQTGVIIRRTSSMTPPDDYLKIALEQNPTAWGCAIATPEGLMTNSGDEPMDPEVLADTLKDFETREIYFYLCNSESAINMDDVSPHWLLEKDDNPLLICFIEGGFPGFAKADSSHPSEYHYLEDFLKPKINDLWELCDGDLNKLMTFIEKPGFKKDVMIHANPRGNICFIATNGKAVTFAQGDTHAEYPWGWVSQNYGYAQAKKEESAGRKKLFPSKSTVREAAKTSVPAVPETVGNAPKGGEAVVMRYGVRKEKPRDTDSRGDRKTFYQRRIGYCPIGWDTKPYTAIEVWYDLQTNQTVYLSEIKKLGVEAIGVPRLNNPQRATAGKDVEPNNIDKGGRETGPAVTDEVLPIMPPKSREFAKDILRREDVKKMIAENGEVLTDPKSIKALEEKFADFSTQLGMKDGIKDFMRLDFAWHVKMAEDKLFMANYAWNLRNMFIAASLKAGNKLTKEEEHVLANEELAPKRKSLFPQRQVA